MQIQHATKLANRNRLSFPLMSFCCLNVWGKFTATANEIHTAAVL